MVLASLSISWLMKSNLRPAAASVWQLSANCCRCEFNRAISSDISDLSAKIATSLASVSSSNFSFASASSSSTLFFSFFWYSCKTTALRRRICRRSCLMPLHWPSKSAARAAPSAARICFSWSIAFWVMVKIASLICLAVFSSGNAGVNIPGSTSKPAISILHLISAAEANLLSLSIYVCRAFSSMSKSAFTGAFLSRSTQLTIPRDKFFRRSLSMASSRNASVSGSFMVALK